MCGIAGFIGFNDNIALARKANSIQKHRGPDHQGIWGDNHLAFAHQRLSIIDLTKKANQPFVKKNLVIIFNGEIYNYKELQALLKQKYGVRFLSNSDTEVVLEMFRYYKEKCLDYFLGMFSFAIYNPISKRLFLARDHFGIKPLFYTRTKKGFAFASELKTLISVPGFNKEINFKSLVNSLNYLWIPGDESMFIGCDKLPPAHFMIISENMEILKKQYWELKDCTKEHDEAYLISALQNVLEETMDRHMVADVPVSAFLSGGLDSSLISVMAKKRNPNLSTYTIGTHVKDKMVERMPDDEKYASKLAHIYGFDHNTITIEADIIHQLPAMVRTLDEPIGDPAAINTYLICQAAKKKGVKVLLSGMGADELFLGYRRQKANLLAKQYSKIPQFIRSPIEKIVSCLPVTFSGRGLKLSRWSKRFISFAGLPAHEAYRMSYSYYTIHELLKLFNYQHFKEIKKIGEAHRILFTSKYEDDLVNQMCYTDIHYFMVGLNLTYSDRASMAASVEVRVPFIDRKVVEFAMQIPGKFKYKNHKSKYILKKAAERYLPSDIINRPKASFGAPIRSWISGDLRYMVDELLSSERITKRGIFNPDYVHNLIKRDRNGVEDNAYRIYQLLTIELWFKNFIDQEQPNLEF